MPYDGKPQPPNRGRRRFLRLAATASIAGGLAGCTELELGGGASDIGDRSDDPIRIGLSLPFTGFMSEEGPEFLLGSEYWRQELNAAGGLLDRPVEFVVYDDGSTEAGAETAYARLLDEDDVDLVLGTAGTLASAGAIRALESRAMPAIFPMAWGPYAQDIDREWCVPFLPVATEAPRGLVEVLSNLDVDTFALIKSSSGYVRDGANGLVQYLQDADIEVVEEVTYERYNAAERRDAVDRVADVDADVVGPGGAVAEVNPLIDLFDQRDMGDTAFAWFDFDDTRIFSRMEHTEGMMGIGMWAAEVPYPGNDDFVASFGEWARKRRPDWSTVRILQHHAPAAYAGATVLQRAVEDAGTIDPPDVRDALWALETETVFGPFGIDAEGYQAAKEMFVLQHQRSIREVIWPPDISTAEARLPTLPRTAPG